MPFLVEVFRIPNPTRGTVFLEVSIRNHERHLPRSDNVYALARGRREAEAKHSVTSLGVGLGFVPRSMSWECRPYDWVYLGGY